MNRALAELGRAQRLEILRELKLSEGLSVREIAARLGMSYMGIKQHCISLERGGFVDTRRKPRTGVGRPEMLYRLTRKADELFPAEPVGTTLALLDASRQLWGPTAAGKLLYVVFRDLGAGYAERVQGDTPAERAKWLARIRDREGHLSRLETGGERTAIVERHSPIAGLFDVYPEAARLEQQMFADVLGTPVRRTATRDGGSYRAEFAFDA